GAGRDEIPASLRQFSSVYLNARRSNHRPLPIPARGWTARAACQPCAENRTAAGASDIAIDIKEGWLCHYSDRKVASWLAPRLQPTKERLRSFLGISWRCPRLLHPQSWSTEFQHGRPVGRRCKNPSSWLSN